MARVSVRVMAGLATAVVGSMAFGGLVRDDAVHAQNVRTLVRIRTVSTNTSDGIVLDRAAGTPAVTLDGQTVGTAYVTSFRAHPGVELLPTHIEIQSGGSGSAVVAGLISQDGRFRQTVGFDTFGGGLRFADANYVKAGDDIVVSYQPLPQGPPLSQTLSHAFDFTQNRVDRQIGDTGLTFRPGNVWSVVPAPGQSVRVGDNPSYSFANLVTPIRQGNVNVLRLPDGASGALIACFNSPAVCGLKGIGDYVGFYGTAFSRSPGSLGVVANAASDTILTYRDPSIAPNPAGCPPGQPLPPPLNLIAVRIPGTARVSLRWDSVKCASRYVIRVVDRVSGQVTELSTPVPAIDESDGGLFLVGSLVSVAAVAQDGTLGQFSRPVGLLLILQF